MELIVNVLAGQGGGAILSGRYTYMHNAHYVWCQPLFTIQSNNDNVKKMLNIYKFTI